jgi:hypothetical protein
MDKNLVEIIGKELQKFNITDAAISDMASRYMPLTIKGLDDKEGQKAVHAARIDVKSRRVSVQKTGKELREDALKYQRTVIEEEKRIIKLLEPIEQHLEEEEDRVKNALEEIRLEEERQRQEKINSRIKTIGLFHAWYDGQKYLLFGDIQITLDEIAAASDDDFNSFVDGLLERKSQEEEKQNKIEAERKAEKERMDEMARQQAEERARLAQETEKLRQQQELIEAEKKRILDEEKRKKDAVAEAERIKKAQEEAAEKARIETEARIKKEAEEKAKKEERERLARERKAARQPDKKKLLAFADEFVPAYPVMKTEEGQEVLDRFALSFSTAIDTVRVEAAAL